MAGLQGVDLDKEMKKKGASSGFDLPDDPMLFRDPKEYEKMPLEEREELTKRMIGSHRLKMASTPLGRSI